MNFETENIEFNLDSPKKYIKRLLHLQTQTAAFCISVLIMTETLSA